MIILTVDCPPMYPRENGRGGNTLENLIGLSFHYKVPSSRSLDSCLTITENYSSNIIASN